MINQSKSKNEFVLWMSVAGILFFAIGAHYYFSSITLSLRYLLTMILISFAAYVSTKTKIGTYFLKFWTESTIELKKVVWPKKQEIISSTIAVFVMVVVMGLVLGVMDFFLNKSLKLLLGGF